MFGGNKDKTCRSLLIEVADKISHLPPAYNRLDMACCTTYAGMSRVEGLGEHPLHFMVLGEVDYPCKKSCGFCGDIERIKERCNGCLRWKKGKCVQGQPTENLKINGTLAGCSNCNVILPMGGIGYRI